MPCVINRIPLKKNLTKNGFYDKMKMHERIDFPGWLNFGAGAKDLGFYFREWPGGFSCYQKDF
jgi:hypothetical protein